MNQMWVVVNCDIKFFIEDMYHLSVFKANVMHLLSESQKLSMALYYYQNDSLLTLIMTFYYM